MPSAFHYTWFETTDLIVTAHILLPCSVAPPLSQHCFDCLCYFSTQSTGNRHKRVYMTPESKITHMSTCGLSPITAPSHVLSARGNLPGLVSTCFTSPPSVSKQTICHFFPTSLWLAHFKTINEKRQYYECVNKKQMRRWESSWCVWLWTRIPRCKKRDIPRALNWGHPLLSEQSAECWDGELDVRHTDRNFMFLPQKVNWPFAMPPLFLHLSSFSVLHSTYETTLVN